MSRRAAQSGFALLVALVLVVLAGVALAALARRSAAEALESQTALEDLQRRWAVTSCRAALLGRAEELLDMAERGQESDGGPPHAYRRPPMPEWCIACRLAGADYELVLTDEQAKLNLNRHLAQTSRAEAASAAARLTAASRELFEQPVAINLKTLVRKGPSVGGNTTLSAVGGYGQVFGPVPPELLVGREQAPGLAAAITCWGDGRVNLRRAPDAVVRQACDRALGRDVVGMLLAARRRDPYRALSAMLAELDEIAEAQRTDVLACLTDRSQCHGLWVIARGPRRSCYTLAVQVTGDLGVSRRHEFEW